MIESLSIEKTIYFGGNLKCSHIKTRKNPLVSKFEYKSNPTILDLHVVSIISSMTQNTRLCPNWGAAFKSLDQSSSTFQCPWRRNNRLLRQQTNIKIWFVFVNEEKAKIWSFPVQSQLKRNSRRVCKNPPVKVVFVLFKNNTYKMDYIYKLVLSEFVAIRQDGGKTGFLHFGHHHHPSN